MITDDRYNHRNRRKYSLKVHIVLVTKYRKQILKGFIADDVKQQIYDIEIHIIYFNQKYINIIHNIIYNILGYIVLKYILYNSVWFACLVYLEILNFLLTLNVTIVRREETSR